MSSSSSSSDDDDENHDNGQNQQHPYVDMECSEDDEEASSADSSDSISESDDENASEDESMASSFVQMEIPDDPSAPIMSEDSEDAAKMRSSLYSSLNREELAKPMHVGDDEGRLNTGRGRRKTRVSSSSFSSQAGQEVEEEEGRNRQRPRQQDNNIVVPRQRPRFVVAKCWLCMFANCATARHVTNFIAQQAGNMDPAIMAQQIKAVVLKQYPRARGIGRRHILRHIREHMLAPTVRLGSMVRGLLSLAETLRTSIQQRDECTGDLVIDKNSTELYLKVLGQVSSVYKTDSSKLLFAPVPFSSAAASGSGDS